MKRIISFLLLLTMVFCAVQPLAVAGSTLKIGDPDGNGKCNAADALFVLKVAVNKLTATNEEITAGDVDGSGKCDAADALMILQYAVGKRTAFPAEMDAEELYYYNLDSEYRINYSDFDDEIITLDGTDDAAAIIEALGGDPEKADVEGYGTTEDGNLSYTPISNEAARMGELTKYNASRKLSGTVVLGDTTVQYSIPTAATAYDAIPITYSVYSTTTQTPIHIEATAFEEADRYESGSTNYFDCNLPGNVSVDISYEGYVNGNKTAGTPLLSYDTTMDIQGTKYPAYDTTDLTKSGTIKADAYYTWFKFKFKNTGDTILDGEGNSTFRFEPLLYKKSGNNWVLQSGTPNNYYPFLDYVYPGEEGEFWATFCPDNIKSGLSAGDYRIVINGWLRNEQDSFDFSTMQVAGKKVTTATFDFKVTAEGEMTTPNSVKNSSNGYIARNKWLGNFEEFLSSYTSLQTVGTTRNNARTGTLYVQAAPWTEQIVLKIIHGDTNEIKCVRLPLDIESDSISITLNPYNQNYVINEDGTREPMVMTQNMVDMRGNIDRGPYCDEHILNELRNMQEAGVNTITTTHAYTGDYTGLYDMTYYMLDCAREMGFTLEGHALYYYRNTSAKSRVLASVSNATLGSNRDITNQIGVDSANGLLARWNYIRYGDMYHYDPVSKVIPISIEENFGWLTYNLKNRYGIDNSYADRSLYKWLKSAYNDDIRALNQKYGTSYGDFKEISVSADTMSDGVASMLIGEVYGSEWNAATVELDLFRTVERTNYYKEMLNYMDVENAMIYLRSENGIFLAPGISETTTNAHYRQIYYEQRQSASVPEILAASGIIYGDSSYNFLPLTDSEVYELTRQAAKGGFVTAKTPAFNHLTDIVVNDCVGSFDYADTLNTESYQRACAIGRNASLFTWCKAIYEAGGVPGLMWMDYACDLYCTTTQYKELQFLNQKFQEMLSTEEGIEWATNIPDDEATTPNQDIVKGVYSYPEAYIEEKLTSVKRKNIIMNFVG